MWEERQLPPVNHLVALLEPAKARHPTMRSRSIQVDDHVVLCHHQLQGADHVSDTTNTDISGTQQTENVKLELDGISVVASVIVWLVVIMALQLFAMML